MAEIEREDRGAVRRLRIVRPEKRNALTGAMYAALAEAFETAGAEGARAVWLRGLEGCFTSGNDIEDFRARAAAGETDGAASPALRFLRALAACPVPVVASVSGHAVGIGTTLLLHCDLVYLASDARLQLPFASLGLCPEGASSLLLPRLAGGARAAELLMLGEAFGAEEAVAIGLANAVLPDAASADAMAAVKAEALAARPRAALGATKALLRRWTREAVEAAFAAEAAEFARLLRGPEAREALAAFAEKRPPDFSRL